MARIDDLIQRRKHPDPLALERDEPSAQAEERRLRLAATGMQALRKSLLVGGIDDVRASVLDDLHGFFTDSYFSPVDQAELIEREKVAMWSINLIWYAYLQAEGFAHPVQVDIAAAAPAASPGRHHLDFGSGVGVTSQLFHSMGFEVELADVETGLLDFAEYRLERRGIKAQRIQLGRQPLKPNSYDAVTAIDSLMFVPDFRAAAREIRDATRTGGVLFANFDTRRGVKIGWDIVYDDDLWLRHRLQEVGFEPELKLGGGVRRYRALETGGVRHLARRVRDGVLFPVRRARLAARARLPVRRG